jgi:hypothetical protein
MDCCNKWNIKFCAILHYMFHKNIQYQEMSRSCCGILNIIYGNCQNHLPNAKLFEFGDCGEASASCGLIGVKSKLIWPLILLAPGLLGVI